MCNNDDANSEYTNNSGIYLYKYLLDIDNIFIIHTRYYNNRNISFVDFVMELKIIRNILLQINYFKMCVIAKILENLQKI